MRTLSSPRPASSPLGLSILRAGLVAALALVAVPAHAQDDKPQDPPPAPGQEPPARIPATPPKLPMSPLAGPAGVPAAPSAQRTAPDEPAEKTGGATVIQNEGGQGGVSVKKVPCVPPTTKVTMDFVDSPLLDVTKYMAEITCRNFILGDKLDGQITIISHQQVSVAEAYEAYLSALEVAGYTTVTVGKNTKVVKESAAGQAPLKIGHGDAIPETDNFVTQIIELENVSISSISSIVSGLAGPSAKIITYEPTNTLIITDAGYNIRRVYRIIKELDVAAPKASLEVIPIRYALASEVQRILEALYPPATGTTSTTSSTGGGAAAATTGSRRRRSADAAPAEAPATGSVTSVSGEGSYVAKMMSDERTNSLIVLANEDALKAIKDLIKKLDVDVDPYSRATIHVIQLNYAKAEDVASVLSNLTDTRSSSSGGSSRTGSTSTRSNTGSRSNTGARSTGGSASKGRPGESGGAGPDGLPGGLSTAPSGGGGGGGGAAFDSSMRITADENTNRLLVIASPDDFKVIERVVKELDVRRQQVFIEAVVVEIGSDDEVSTGVAVHGGKPGEEGGITYASGQLGGSSISLPISDTASLVSGLAVGVMGKAIDITIPNPTDPTTTTTLAIPAFGIALNALASNSQVEILSNPSLLCVDNEEATINVGRNVPFPVSAGRDNNNNPIVSYQREDVGITLKVTPQINEANFVTMDLNLQVQEVEEDSSGLDVNTAGFITSKRETENVVVVRDNQTIVIGGLIGNTETTVETKIPILGDLPLIGVLFRGKRNTERKTNLLIFLTPHVINEPADLEEVYRVKMLQRDEFLRRFYGKSREQQEEEFADLMKSSMNLIDKPSVYREKAAPSDTPVAPITMDNTGVETVPQPSAEVPPAGEAPPPAEGQ